MYMFDTHMEYLQCASEVFQVVCGLVLVLTRAPDQSHFDHVIVQCAPTLTSIQDLFQPNS